MSEKAKSLFKDEKAVKTIAIGAVLVIVLLVMSGMLTGSDKGYSIPKQPTPEEYEQRLEQKLHHAISAIDGVGELTIIVNLDSLSETVYSDKGNSVRTVITPKVRGVAIICDGGGDIIIKQKIVELVSRVLGIGSTRISVTN